MDESQEPGSVHGSLTSSDLSLGRKQNGLTTGTLVENDKREMSKPYDRREAFVKALQKSADRENEQRRAMSIAEVQAEIWKVVNGFHITGPGVTGQGTSWSVHPEQPRNQNKTDSVAAADMHPFKVLDASSSGHMKVKVYADSFLFDTTDLTAPVSITGLNTNSPDIAVGNITALKILTDSTLAVTGASIIYDTVDWGGYPAMYHIDSSDPDNPFVDEIRVLLAEIVDVIDTRAGTTITDGTNTAKIVQRWRNNILLFAYPDAAGVPAYLPMPFA